MTTRTVDEAALLEAIRLQPDEDTPRLALADALDERGDAARAEFIRVQVEVARTTWYREPRCMYGLDYHGPVDGHDAKLGHPCPSCNPKSKPLVARESALLKIHEAEWRTAGPCETCGGEGRVLYRPGPQQQMLDCPDCDETGDAGGLMENLNGRDAKAGMWRYRVDFRRGFPGVVHAALGECIAEERAPCDACRGGFVCGACRAIGRPTRTVASPWARRVARHHPVSGFRVTDREPRHGQPGGSVWWTTDPDRPNDGPGWLPAFVFDALPGEKRSWRTHNARVSELYPTAELAHAALGAALVALARG